MLAAELDKANMLRQYEGMTPNDPVEPLVHELTTAAGPSLAIVGHLPFLSKLASRLLCGDETTQPIAFYNAGIVCLVKTDVAWQVEWIVQPWIL